MTVKPDGTQRGCVTCLVVFLAVTCGLGIALFLGVRHLAQGWADDEALMDTSHAIASYIAERREWPPNWEALSPHFGTLVPPRSDSDGSRARDRIEVNFQVDVRKAPQASDWYIRLRSRGKYISEGDINHWLSRRITELQKNLRQPNSQSK